MGNDGGSIPHRRELVKNKAKPQQKDANNIRRAVWNQCALSKKPLQQPVVMCPLGKLFNKDAILEFLLDRSAYGDGDSICGYVRSMKDTTTLNLTPNPNPTPSTSTTTDVTSTPALFVCPLTLKEMNGSLPFVALSTCGCVFSEAALKAVTQSTPLHPPSTASSDLPPSPPSSGSDPESSTSTKTKKMKEVSPRPSALCPQCSTPFFPHAIPASIEPPMTPTDLASPSSIVTINPPQDVQEDALIALNTHRALLKSLKSSSSSSKKRKSTSTTTDPSLDTSSSSSNKKSKDSSSSSSNVPLVKSIAGGASKVARELSAAEERRKKEFEGMTHAVRSLYAPKGKKDEEFGNANFMTRGTFTRYA